jgi:hypothetical protein
LGKERRSRHHRPGSREHSAAAAALRG